MKWTPPFLAARFKLGAALAALLAGQAFVAPSASAQYEIKSGVNNRLSQRVPANNVNKIPPVGPAATPTGDPTITPQYSNVVESSATAGPISNGYPRSAGVNLQKASLGTTFASGVPRYFFGDEITPPVTLVNQQGVQTTIASPSTFWRAEPVYPGETLTNPSGATPTDYRTGQTVTAPALPEGVLTNYYFSPHAHRVFANTPGNVTVTWRSSVPDSTSNSYIFVSETFTVSSATTSPVRSMYWTEKSYNGPRITIPSGRIVTVNPVYSNVFPETVEKEYVVTGSSGADPNAGATQVLRTLWYEKTNGTGELHAYNQEGRILVEYLGELREDGSHEFLGADIVSVQQSLKASTLTVELGNEIRPSPDENLVALPVTTSSATNQVSYYGSNPRPDGSLAYYAERENDVEDRVVFYWLETNDAAIPETANVAAGLTINWPKYLNKYLHVWPSEVTKFAQYTVGHGGSTVSTGTGLKFENGKIPQIIYQDSANGESLIDTVSQRLIVDLSTSGDQQNRTLLKFSGDNGGVWYVPLMTQSEDRSGYLEGDGTAAVSGTVYVGERINPPSSAYVSAGYISSGTSYSPTAWKDPFASGITEAMKGSIIPVNALPGAQNPLTVWWFKKVPAKSAEFADFYTPAKIGHYNVAYRESVQAVSETFESGVSGWTSNATTAGGPSGSFLGPYAKSAVTVAQKSFDLTNNLSGAGVSFNFYRLDQWNGESIKVLVDGNTVINEALSQSEVTATRSGTITFGNRTYSWTLAPVAGGFTNFYGQSTVKDQQFLVSILVIPQTGTSVTSVSVGLASTLTQSVSTQAYGMDNFAINVTLPQIVLASNQGTGSLSTAEAAGLIYNQPDASKIGYNPNEEHALMLGGRGYAMRDDLNVTTDTGFTSLPRVLLQYTDPADSRPSMAVYEVVRESPLYKFSYPVTAGTILSSPMPLPLMPQPLDANGVVRNIEVSPAGTYTDRPAGAGAPAEYTPFTYKDRKGYDWVYRGPHSGGSPSLGMQFYYTMRADFSFPGLATQPAAGTALPFLRPQNADGSFAGDPVTGTPLTVL